MTRRSLLGAMLALSESRRAAAQTGPVRRTPEQLLEQFDQYLKDKAAEITDRSLSDVTDLQSWTAKRPQLRKQLLSSLGLDPLPVRTPLQARTTGVLRRDGYRVEKVVFESLPKVYVTANLYLPESNTPAPAVLYLCGHHPSPAGAKVGYQHHGIWLAKHGFAAFLVDTIEFAEVPGIHHGIYNLEMWHWLSLGYTPAGPEVWNGMRAIDYLETRREVDIRKLGVTGISGGGIISWYLPAVDDRIQVVASVCGTWTAKTQLALNAVQENCDCVYIPNRFQLDLPAIGGLIAPRPFKMLGALRDEMFPPAGYRDAYQRVRRIYALHNAADHVAEYEHDSPHQDIVPFRKEANEWLNRWLRNDSTPFDEGVIQRETPEALTVLDHFPSGAINDEVEHRFIASTALRPWRSATAWQQRRKDLLTLLRQETFAAFPTAIPPADVSKTASRDWTERYAESFRVQFTTEPGIRVSGQLLLPRRQGVTEALIWVEGDDDLIDPVNYDRVLSALGRLIVLFVQPRGIGLRMDRTRLANTKRSAAILGATLESMQVWDILRSVDYLVTAERLPIKTLSVFGRRNMAIPALYAAALDPRITRVVLEDPPSSHWHGPAFLNILRTTDIPEVAALVAPRQLTFITPPPPAFEYTHSIYRLCGSNDAFRNAGSLSRALEL